MSVVWRVRRRRSFSTSPQVFSEISRLPVKDHQTDHTDRRCGNRLVGLGDPSIAARPYCANPACAALSLRMPSFAARNWPVHSPMSSPPPFPQSRTQGKIKLSRHAARKDAGLPAVTTLSLASSERAALQQALRQPMQQLIPAWFSPHLGGKTRKKKDFRIQLALHTSTVSAPASTRNSGRWVVVHLGNSTPSNAASSTFFANVHWMPPEPSESAFVLWCHRLTHQHGTQPALLGLASPLLERGHLNFGSHCLRRVLPRSYLATLTYLLYLILSRVPSL